MYDTGNKFSVGEKSNRNCSKFTNKCRVLFDSVSGRKENRRLPDGFKSKKPKQVYKNSAFQNGNFKVGRAFSRYRGLGLFIGSFRRLFTYSHTSKKQTIPTFCSRWNSLPVLCSSIRNRVCSKNFHQNRISNPVSSKTERHSSPCISGRLADSGKMSKQSFCIPNPHGGNHSEIRLHNKLGEVKSCYYPENHISGSVHQFKIRSDFSHGGSLSETERFNSQIPELRFPNSTQFSEVTGINEFMHRPCTMGKITHAPSTNTSTGLLENCRSGFNQVYFGHKSSEVSPAMVVKTRKYVKRSRFETQETLSDSHNRCLHVRLGSPLGSNASCGNLVRKPSKTTHKLPRDDGCFSRSETLRETLGKQGCLSQNRQYNSYVLHKQTGGDSIPKSVHFDLEYVSVGNKTQDSLDSATRIGSEQLFSRSTIKGDQNKEHGVDFEKVCGPNNFSDVGNSTCRPICHSTESPNSNICIPISRRISPDSGCSVDQLEGCDRLCIPSHCSNSQSPAENSGRGLQDNSHCTILDKTTLVSNFNTVTGRLPCETTRDQRSDKSTQKQVVSSKRKHVKADSMEIISRQLVKKGFSRSVSKRAASCWRASTYSTYNNRLRVFFNWARRKHIDPLQASESQIAEFLEHLFRARKLKARTIAGYKSAISAVHPGWDGVGVGKAQTLEKLVKAYFLERPPERKLVPPWDIGFVLETLCKYPFEPLNEVPLKFLTFKTLFLISAASGRRRSFIHALSVDEGHIRWDKDGVSLIPAPGFLAKNESINYLSQKVFLPKMSKVSSVIEDQVLCPCRALKRYLKATEGLRAGSKKLFISYKTHKPITRDTISNWIVKTIKMSYDNLEGVRAHDVRSLSTSWALFKSVPVNEIMEAASWKAETTFTSFYLKDMCSRGKFGKTVLSAASLS